MAKLLARWVAKLVGRWVAKLVAHLLATAVPWVRIQTSYKKYKEGDNAKFFVKFNSVRKEVI
jgi:hypothetical protein